MASKAVTLMILTAAGLGAMQAAEKIRWEDLQKRTSGELRSVNVITRDGQKLHAQRLEFRSGQLALYNHDSLAYVLLREDVARVEVRHRKRYHRHIGENIQEALMLPIGSETACGLALATVLAPPFLAYGIASAPVFLAADGITLLMPAKAFEVVP